MPQFDFFIWFSLSLCTIITFQLLYYCILYYIIAPFADFQKTLIKLYVLFRRKKNEKIFLDYSASIYFSKVHKKIDLDNSLPVKKNDIAKNFAIFFFKKKVIAEPKKKKIKFFNTKKFLILKTVAPLKNTNIFLISKKKIKKKLKKKRRGNGKGSTKKRGVKK